MSTNLQTRLTLIQRAKEQRDEFAWQEFVHYYHGFIYKLLKDLQVQSQDLDDLSQLILLKLWENLPKYEKKETKFRTWLSTVIKNTTFTYFRDHKQRHQETPLVDDNLEQLLSSNTTDLERLMDEEWQKHLTTLTMQRIAKAYRGHALEVFELSLSGVSAEEIAQKLNLSLTSVYTLRNRVKTSFVNELRRLMAELEF